MLMIKIQSRKRNPSHLVDSDVKPSSAGLSALERNNTIRLTLSFHFFSCVCVWVVVLELFTSKNIAQVQKSKSFCKRTTHLVWIAAK